MQKIGSLINCRSGEHQTLNYRLWLQILDATTRRLDLLRKEIQEPVVRKSLEHKSIDVGASLRAILYTQSKGIVEEFHVQRSNYVSVFLAEEKWERCDSTKEHRACVAYLCGESQELLCGQEEPEAKNMHPETTAKTDFLKVDNAELKDLLSEEQRRNMVQDGQAERYLKVGKLNFLTVPSTLMILRVVTEYLQLCKSLPLVAVCLILTP